jgi:hypothetical protein
MAFDIKKDSLCQYRPVRFRGIVRTRELALRQYQSDNSLENRQMDVLHRRYICLAITHASA